MKEASPSAVSVFRCRKPSLHPQRSLEDTEHQLVAGHFVMQNPTCPPTSISLFTVQLVFGMRMPRSRPSAVALREEGGDLTEVWSPLEMKPASTTPRSRSVTVDVPPPKSITWCMV